MFASSARHWLARTAHSTHCGSLIRPNTPAPPEQPATQPSRPVWHLRRRRRRPTSPPRGRLRSHAVVRITAMPRVSRHACCGRTAGYDLRPTKECFLSAVFVLYARRRREKKHMCVAAQCDIVCFACGSLGPRPVRVLRPARVGGEERHAVRLHPRPGMPRGARAGTVTNQKGAKRRPKTKYGRVTGLSQNHRHHTSAPVHSTEHTRPDPTPAQQGVSTRSQGSPPVRVLGRKTSKRGHKARGMPNATCA